jgi:uroporphyrinogen decarboxylase
VDVSDHVLNGVPVEKKTRRAKAAGGTAAVSNRLQASRGTYNESEESCLRRDQWKLFRQTAKREQCREIPLALIVDSPWMPGYLGINHLDYFFDAETWFRANLRIHEDFPDVIFVPSWWAEFGMAIEPSAFGGRMRFYGNRTPDVAACLRSAAEGAALTPADPATDGLMPLALHRLIACRQRVHDSGHVIPFATARGPLCVASFLRGITEFMLDLSEHPDEVHHLLETLTATIIRWLEAQCDALKGDVEGVLLLDDVPGLLSRGLYQQFAEPYLKRIFAAFPEHWVKVYHNDANVKPFAADLAGLGIDVLNWSHRLSVTAALQATGGKFCLMGNVAPLELGVNGTPDQVRTATREVLAQASGHPFILSVGGGVSPGMPGANIRAMLGALRERASA